MQVILIADKHEGISSDSLADIVRNLGHSVTIISVESSTLGECIVDELQKALTDDISTTS